MKRINVSLQSFENVAKNNGYEVFTPEEVASYYKEGLMKSMDGQMDSKSKEEFVSDIMHLQKAVVSDENGKETVRYYRKAQVKWEETANGVILKGIEGVYTDTPENRRLNRVGEAYVAEENVVKSILDNNEDILKAVRTGRYADTSENRRLHRVGQPYKTRVNKKEDNDSSKSEDIESIMEKFSNMFFDGKDSRNYIEKYIGKGSYDKAWEKVNKRTFDSSTDKRNAFVEEIEKMLFSNFENKVNKKLEQKSEKKETGDKGPLADLDKKLKEFNDSHKGFINVSGGNRVKITGVKPNGDLEVIYARLGEKDWKDVVKKGSDDYRELKAYGKIPKSEEKVDNKKETSVLSTLDKFEEQYKKNKEEREKVYKKDPVQTTAKEGEEESYTRVKFDDIPNSGKVNLKKYLTPKRKAAADNNLGDLGSMDISSIKKKEKELVDKFNKDFDTSKKSQRAEDLYSIMKIKAEIAKRGNSNDNKTYNKKISDNKPSKKEDNKPLKKEVNKTSKKESNNSVKEAIDKVNKDIMDLSEKADKNNWNLGYIKYGDVHSFDFDEKESTLTVYASGKGYGDSSQSKKVITEKDWNEYNKTAKWVTNFRGKLEPVTTDAHGAITIAKELKKNGVDVKKIVVIKDYD